MKRIFKFSIVALLVAVGACSDDDTLPVNFDELIVSGGPFATDLTPSVVTDINKLDPAGSSFSKTFQLVSPDGGTDVTKIDMFVTHIRGVDTINPEAFLKTFDSAGFTMGDQYPEALVDVVGSEIISALNITDLDVIEGGDTFNYRLEITNDEGTFGDVSANFDNQSADHTFSSTVICALPALPTGTWTVNMADSYGDGWQPVTSSGGGPGIVVTLSNGTVFEIGLCTPYEDPGYDCTAGDSSGTATFEVPADVTGDFEFRGDFWGEMSFQIISPSGNTVAAGTPGTAAGPIALNLCNE